MIVRTPEDGVLVDTDDGLALLAFLTETLGHADPPFLRDRLPEILGDRPWWDTPHSIRTRVTRRTLAEIEEEFRQAARDAYLVGPGFIVPDALRASLAGILECERLGLPYVEPELWGNAVRTRPPRSWARRTAARLAALLKRFAG